MSRANKIAAVLVGVALVLVLGTGILVAGTAATSVAGGLMTVSVQESGPDGASLYVPVPAGLIHAALAVAPAVVRLSGHHGLENEIDHLREELDEMLPALEVVLDAIPDLPDAVLVEVEDGDEYVRISKEGDALRVLVLEDGSRVGVTIPVSVVRSLRGLLRI